MGVWPFPTVLIAGKKNHDNTVISCYLIPKGLVTAEPVKQLQLSKKNYCWIYLDNCTADEVKISYVTSSNIWLMLLSKPRLYTQPATKLIKFFRLWPKLYFITHKNEAITCRKIPIQNSTPSSPIFYFADH
jgi:hypothetical protein